MFSSLLVAGEGATYLPTTDSGPTIPKHLLTSEDDIELVGGGDVNSVAHPEAATERHSVQHPLVASVDSLDSSMDAGSRRDHLSMQDTDTSVQNNSNQEQLSRQGVTSSETVTSSIEPQEGVYSGDHANSTSTSIKQQTSYSPTQNRGNGDSPAGRAYPDAHKPPSDPQWSSYNPVRLLVWIVSLLRAAAAYVEAAILHKINGSVQSIDPPEWLLYLLASIAAGPLKHSILKLYATSGDHTRRLTAITANAKFASMNAGLDDYSTVSIVLAWSLSFRMLLHPKLFGSINQEANRRSSHDRLHVDLLRHSASTWSFPGTTSIDVV